MNKIIIGTQWGDEGKGKVIDFLARKADIVVRAAGGNNAGHTVKIGKKKYALHLVPSGVLNKRAINVIGNGVVLDIKDFFKELSELEGDGIDTSKVFISDRAHIVFPYHKKIDELEEKAKGRSGIGTTGKGIGPCYADKVSRCGIRTSELYDLKNFEKKLRVQIKNKNKIITKLYGAEKLDEDKIVKEYLSLGRKLVPLLRDTGAYIFDAMKSGKEILFEGAQATMLDIDHGTYPFVTSSNPTFGGFSVGSGIALTGRSEIIGIAKAYTTRVGAGPFVTEQDNEIGETLRNRGNEYGTTTGRPRRCGWLDLVILKYAARVNGLSCFALMLTDVLDTLEAINVCTGYEIDGKIYKDFPANDSMLSRAKPIYEKLKGWKKDITKIKEYKNLPKETKSYIKFIEDFTGVKVKIISVGPERNQTIMR